ncbi:hypothetical protein MUK42_31713 [Musa troglodytarum]|uniref:Uncharacterized protein n=1 Tax=Musa troglodytarum TaxID=320322 RepID=A0A9E7F3J1_9LILI|nr:hypothetical protein MUK42_31713 [Musa troglodytarum]
MYIAWKLSRFSPKWVIGSGTNLDSSSFQFLLIEVNGEVVSLAD